MSDTPEQTPAEGAVDDEPSPIARESIAALHKSVAGLWRRIEKRAPPEVKARVDEIMALADQVLAEGEHPVWLRLDASKKLEDLSIELRGRKPWDVTFYRDGRLAIVRAQDPITIRGAVDHARIERFYDRYVRRAEEAYARMQYFLDRAGALLPEEKKVSKKPWEQPYIALDSYRELIWGKVQKKDPHVRRE